MTAPLDDIRALARGAPGPDAQALAAAQAFRASRVAMSHGLGLLGDLFDWLAATTGRMPPTFRAPKLALYAARHGAADHDPLSPSASDVRRHLEWLAAGGGIANALCAEANMGLQVFDLAPEEACGNPAVEPALSERACAATIAFGMEAVAGEVDLLCLGDIASGAGFGAAAILDPGAAPASWGVHKGPALDDPLEALRRFGGRETSALVGAILAAAHQKVPVILDGLPALAAAWVVHRLAPQAIAHCRLSELRHDVFAPNVAAMGLDVLMAVGLHAGEGAAAALALPLARTAVSLHLAMPARPSRS